MTTAATSVPTTSVTIHWNRLTSSCPRDGNGGEPGAQEALDRDRASDRDEAVDAVACSTRSRSTETSRT